MSEPFSDPIDLSVLEELQSSVGSEFVAELVGTYLEETPTLMTALARAHGAGDATEFRRLAHSIKSSSSAFGAAELAGLARALELGGVPADGAPLAALGAAYERAAARLTELRRG
jgi:HPt (histidine-containing phosphotransfer) domain-containing protein